MYDIRHKAHLFDVEKNGVVNICMLGDVSAPLFLGLTEDSLIVHVLGFSCVK